MLLCSICASASGQDGNVAEEYDCGSLSCACGSVKVLCVVPVGAYWN